MNAIGFIFAGGSGRALSPKAEKVARFLMATENAGRIQTREAIAAACDFEANGRSCDTYISEIRLALGDHTRIVSCQGVGYLWMGEPIDLVAHVKVYERKTTAPVTLAVITRAEVAKQLGMTEREVERIEKKALSKIRKNEGLRSAWNELKRDIGRVSYDPFHEIWMFSVNMFDSKGEYVR